MLDEFLLHLFYQGNCIEAYKLFGAHVEKDGVRFTVYAPHALSVQVVGDFNAWGENKIYLDKIKDDIFSLFVPGLEAGHLYKYRIETQHGTHVDKSDPYAFFSELRPNTASRLYDLDGFKWDDQEWMEKRTACYHDVLNIYEVQAGSWKMKKEFTDEEDGEYYTYDELIDMIIPYVKERGFSHIEFMPLNEFPFDGSWGYQATGYMSATSRYGTPHQLMALINACHKADLGVILDFVPTHFVKDAHGLACFDGGYVYEYPQDELRETEWGSCYFDVGRNEVRSFLMSAVHIWIDYYHIDGIRFDAVSHLIYWKGQEDRGVNDGGIEFTKKMNHQLKRRYPDVMLIAEDSSSFPQVTHSIEHGGLGFDYKWDLGWMNDTLAYFKKDPVMRQSQDIHYKLTFSMMYFYRENYILPFSHDEVVHSKGTILDKIWGNHDQKIAQCRSLYMYMMTHPGKKLNFMGNEFAEYKEWDEKKAIGWSILEYGHHKDFFDYLTRLNHLVKSTPALYECDFEFNGFEWLVADDNLQSIYAYTRYDRVGNAVVTILNFIGNKHQGYRIPVSHPGKYELIMSTQDHRETFVCETIEGQTLNKAQYLSVDIDPFESLMLVYKREG